MIEVLQLAVANIREFLALQEVEELQVRVVSGESPWPQLEEFQSMVARVEVLLSHYETELPKRLTPYAAIQQNAVAIPQMHRRK